MHFNEPSATKASTPSYKPKHHDVLVGLAVIIYFVNIFVGLQDIPGHSLRLVKRKEGKPQYPRLVCSNRYCSDGMRLWRAEERHKYFDRKPGIWKHINPLLVRGLNNSISFDRLIFFFAFHDSYLHPQGKYKPSAYTCLPPHQLVSLDGELERYKYERGPFHNQRNRAIPTQKIFMNIPHGPLRHSH